MKVVLAVGAHPDDIELGCSGTLMLHKLSGDKVYLLVLTKGEASGDPNIREMECKESEKLMGMDDLFFGGLEDTKVGSGRETIDIIEKIVNKVKPDIVYGPACKDTHQDHRNTAYAVLSAARRCDTIMLYEGASTQKDFIPQIFVDIKETYEKKKAVIRVFGSQLNNHHGGYKKGC